MICQVPRLLLLALQPNCRGPSLAPHPARSRLAAARGRGPGPGRGRGRARMRAHLGQRLLLLGIQVADSAAHRGLGSGLWGAAVAAADGAWTRSLPLK